MGGIHAVFPSVIRSGAPGAQEGWLPAIAKEIFFCGPVHFSLHGGRGPTYSKWRAIAIGGMVFSIGAVFGRFAMCELSTESRDTLATNVMGR